MAILEFGQTNGASEVDRLQTRVRELENECAKLMQALNQAESERSAYRQMFLEQARAAREFEDLDVETLERLSAGSVEFLK